MQIVLIASAEHLITDYSELINQIDIIEMRTKDV